MYSSLLLFALVPSAPLAPAAPAQTPAQVTVLAGADTAGEDWFGDFGIGLHGDTLVVGARFHDHLLPEAGAAYVFRRDPLHPDSWRQVAELLPSDPAVKGYFGSADLWADTAVVGANGERAVYVFARDGGGADGWREVARLTTPSSAAGLGYATRVAIERDTLLVSDSFGLGAGQVFVFERDQGGPGAWGLAATLRASDGAVGDQFGAALEISGDRILVGATGDDALALEGGSAYVFERDPADPLAWIEIRKLLPSASNVLSKFGIAVALFGDVAAVGAEGLSVGGADTGAAFVFERDLGGSGQWGERIMLVASDGAAGDLFGRALDLWGSTLVVGADLNAGQGDSAGAAYVFSRNFTGADQWGERARVTGSGTDAGDRFGKAIALYGDVAAIGSPNDESRGPNSGAVYLFDGLIEDPVSYCTAGLSASGCQAGLTAAGSASGTAATGFSLSASNMEGAASCRFLYSAHGRQAAPWGQGTSYLCVAGPLQGGDPLTSTGHSGHCDGLVQQDMNALWAASPAGPPPAGALVQAQLWYRDPLNTSNRTTSLSDAVEFSVHP